MNEYFQELEISDCEAVNGGGILGAIGGAVIGCVVGTVVGAAAVVVKVTGGTNEQVSLQVLQLERMEEQEYLVHFKLFS